MTLRTIAATVPLTLLLFACGDTGQGAYPLRVEGAGTATGTFAVAAMLPVACAAPCACEDADWLVTIERADVAFGPIYLCASERAEPDRCPESLAEMLEVGVIDATNPAPVLLGEGLAFTGRAQSAMWDYGRSWLFTQMVVLPDPVAPEGHSLVLRGTATKGTTSFRFAADVDIDASEAGLYGVQSAPIAHDFVGPFESLRVQIDPAAWVSRVDFDAVACGRTSESETELTFAPASIAYNALYGAMTNSRLPTIVGESSATR